MLRAFRSSSRPPDTEWTTMLPGAGRLRVRPQPFGRTGVSGDLFVVPRRRCSGIASSSLRDLASRAPPASITVFTNRSTKIEGPTSVVGCDEARLQGSEWFVRFPDRGPPSPLDRDRFRPVRGRSWSRARFHCGSQSSSCRVRGDGCPETTKSRENSKSMLQSRATRKRLPQVGILKR